MTGEQTKNTNKILPIENKIQEVILRLLLGNLPEKATEATHHPKVLFHLLENRKVLFGREFSKSHCIEIISPVPNVVKSQNVTKVSAKSEKKLSPLGSSVELDLEKKSGTLKCFHSRKKKRED